MSDTSDTSATKPSPPLDSSSESDFNSHGSDVLTPSTGSSELSGSQRRQDCTREDRIQQRRFDRDEDEGAERRSIMDATEIEKEQFQEQKLEAREKRRKRREDEKRFRNSKLWWLHEENAKLRKDVLELKEKVFKLSEATVYPPPRFCSYDIGFYENDYGYYRDSPVNYTTNAGQRYYRNIEYFIDAVLLAAKKTPEQVIRDNLQHCLHGDAYTWYSSILTADQREELTKGDGLSNWIEILRGKWGMTAEGAFAKLASLKIEKWDREFDKKFAEKFVLDAVQIGRRIGMETAFSQLTLAYTRLEPGMQAKVKPPTEGESVEDFIEKLRVLKLD